MNSLRSLCRYAALIVATVIFSVTAMAAKDNGMTLQIAKNMETLNTNSELDTAKYIKLAYETIQMATENEQPEVVAPTYLYFITYLVMNTDAERANVELQKLREFTEKNKIGSEAFYTCWQNVIIKYFEDSNPLKAMSEFHEMQKIAEETEDYYGLACAHTAIGAISEFAYDKGIDNFNQAIEYAIKGKHRELLFFIYFRMAELAYSNDRYQDVLKCIDEILTIEEKPYNVDAFVNYLRLLTYLELGNKEEATDAYGHVREVWENGNVPPYFLGKFAKALCSYFCKYGNADEVLQFIDHIDVEEDKAEAMMNYYLTKNDYKQAYEWRVRYDTLQRAEMIKSQQLKVVNANVFYQNKELAAKNLALEMINAKVRSVMLALVLLFVVLAAAYITITARRHNKQLKAERNKAVRLSEMKTTFIKNISHEIRTPLNAIIGFNNLLNTPDFEFSAEERKDMLNKIQVKSDSLLELTDNVMFLSRIGGNDIKPHFEQVYLRDICLVAIESVKDRIANGVALEADKVQTSPVLLNTDRKLLTKAITNVLDNAVKFTTDGKITLDCKTDDKTLTITISDTGSGIPAEAAERVFEHFEKLGSFNSGFGLGLSIAREALSLLGGTITLDKSYTDGASFIISLPL